MKVEILRAATGRCHESSVRRNPAATFSGRQNRHVHCAGVLAEVKLRG